jgi:hypothetical protein
MTRNSNTQDNFLLWFIQEFGFNANAATTLYDEQMLNSLSAKSVLAGETLVAMYSFST